VEGEGSRERKGEGITEEVGRDGRKHWKNENVSARCKGKSPEIRKKTEEIKKKKVQSRIQKKGENSREA